MARETIEWSKKHRTSAIVISKAERSLTLYRSGQKLVSYPVRLGFNGINEKRYQGDGATPEGAIASPASEGAGRHNSIGPCCWIIRTRKIDGGF
jgi:hypothetical protein